MKTFHFFNSTPFSYTLCLFSTGIMPLTREKNKRFSVGGSSSKQQKQKQQKIVLTEPQPRQGKVAALKTGDLGSDSEQDEEVVEETAFEETGLTDIGTNVFSPTALTLTEGTEQEQESEDLFKLLLF